MDSQLTPINALEAALADLELETDILKKQFEVLSYSHVEPGTSFTILDMNICRKQLPNLKEIKDICNFLQFKKVFKVHLYEATIQRLNPNDFCLRDRLCSEINSCFHYISN